MFARLGSPVSTGVSLWAVFVLAGVARADLTPEWQFAASLGPWPDSRLAAMTVDASGATYLVGSAVNGMNADLAVAAYESNGLLRWSRTFDGSSGLWDSATCVALSPTGMLYVGGSTERVAPSIDDALLLRYDAASGALLETRIFSSGGGEDRHGSAVAVDAQGDVYFGVAAGNEDRVELFKFRDGGPLLWTSVLSPSPDWDRLVDLQISPDGEPVVLFDSWFPTGSYWIAHYSVHKLDPSSGATLWAADWVNGGLSEVGAMAIDPNGDVYITGDSFGQERYGTTRIRGSDGQILWQVIDSPTHAPPTNWARPMAVAVDGHGGVYITGAVGDIAVDEFDVYTVKRDSATGERLWTSTWGADCTGCRDWPRAMLVDRQGHVLIAGGATNPPNSTEALLLVLSAATGEVFDVGASGTPGQGPFIWLMESDAEFNLYLAGVVGWPSLVQLIKYASLLAEPVSYCTAGVSTNGCVPAISSSGAPSLSAATGFDLRVDALEGQRQGLFFYGLNGRDAKPWGSAGTSYLCVRPPLQRMGLQNSGGTLGACDGSFSQDWFAHFAAHPQAFGSPFSVGTVVEVQAWYRDSLSAIPTRLSDALEFVFEF